MTALIALPRLELLDPDPAGAVWIDGLQQLDQAVIVIDGREEQTITIDCEGARELAQAIIVALKVADLAIAALPPTDQHQAPYRAIDF